MQERVNGRMPACGACWRVPPCVHACARLQEACGARQQPAAHLAGGHARRVQVKSVLVVGHYNCGAVKCAAGPWSGQSECIAPVVLP